MARGWAHIGALRELGDMGVVPDVIVGASIGAVVGGCFAAGRLDALEDFARSLTRRSVFNLIDVSFRGGGLMGGDRLRARLESAMGQQRIENLPTRFVAVATEMRTGHEVWLKNGLIVDAMRASYALPGIFEPVQDRRPLAVRRGDHQPGAGQRGAGVRRGLGAGAGHRQRRAERRHLHETAEEEERPRCRSRRRAGCGGCGAAAAAKSEGAPGVASVMVDTFNITQDRICARGSPAIRPTI